MNKTGKQVIFNLKGREDSRERDTDVTKTLLKVPGEWEHPPELKRQRIEKESQREILTDSPAGMETGTDEIETKERKGKLEFSGGGGHPPVLKIKRKKIVKVEEEKKKEIVWKKQTEFMKNWLKDRKEEK